MEKEKEINMKIEAGIKPLKFINSFSIYLLIMYFLNIFFGHMAICLAIS